MDYEHITDDMLIEMERMSTKSLTDSELDFVQIKQSIYRIENDLMQVNKNLCIVVSQISNIITVLNDLDTNIRRLNAYGVVVAN